MVYEYRSFDKCLPSMLEAVTSHKTVMVVHDYNPSTQEVERAVESEVQAKIE